MKRKKDPAMEGRSLRLKEGTLLQKREPAKKKTGWVRPPYDLGTFKERRATFRGGRKRGREDAEH